MPTRSGWSKTWTFYRGRLARGQCAAHGGAQPCELGSAHRCSTVRAPSKALHPTSIFIVCGSTIRPSGFSSSRKSRSMAWLGLARDGMRRFETGAALYIRPMYWAEQGGPLLIAPKIRIPPAGVCRSRGADARAGWVFADAVAFRKPSLDMHAGRCRGRLTLSQQRTRPDQVARPRLRQLHHARPAGQCRRAWRRQMYSWPGRGGFPPDGPTAPSSTESRANG